MVCTQSLIGFERICHLNNANVFRDSSAAADTERGGTGEDGFIQKVVSVKLFSGKSDKEFSRSVPAGVGENTVNRGFSAVFPAAV